MDELSEKHDNIEGIIVSDTPSEILKKYSKNKKITFYSLLSQEKLFKDIYPSCDLFLYPTFSDTFGFAILEAQSFGLPVIAQKTQSTHTIHETIKEGKTGFVISNLKANAENNIYSQDVFDKILLATEKTVINKKLMKELSKNCINLIKEGKFSIQERNRQLSRIYFEAIK